MGVAYTVGRGVSQSYTSAAAWYFKAARQGHAVAQNNLGVMYSQGLGVQQNQVQAVKWYTCAAEQGYRGAQENLAKKYVAGIGVPQDYILAHKWLSLMIANDEGAKIPKSVRSAVMTKGNLGSGDSNITDESTQLREKLAVKMTQAQGG